MSEILKTEGVALAIRPWSRTSHVVTWLTPDRGVVATLVKGAVRPKSAFLGQYDLFYDCEILYYAGDGRSLHPLRECTPHERRDGLRGRWRETAIAGYAADLARELAPAGGEARDWWTFLRGFLDRLASGAASPPASVVHLEANVLQLAGLFPDFSGVDAAAPWTPFAVDHGRAGTDGRTYRLPAGVARLLEGALREMPAAAASERLHETLRFLGVFLAHHLDLPPARRRLTLETIGA